MEEIVEKMKNVFVQELDKIRQEMNDLSKQILDRQFVFENTYGAKIDAIFDYVQFHQNNNFKKFNKIDNLEKRIEVVEIHDLNHEKRISNLERKNI